MLPAPTVQQKMADRGQDEQRERRCCDQSEDDDDCERLLHFRPLSRRQCHRDEADRRHDPGYQHCPDALHRAFDDGGRTRYVAFDAVTPDSTITRRLPFSLMT